MSKYAWQIAALVSLVAVLAVWMPARDAEARKAAESEAQAFYNECLPKENQRVIVERHAGNLSCTERHEITGYGR